MDPNNPNNPSYPYSNYPYSQSYYSSYPSSQPYRFSSTSNQLGQGSQNLYSTYGGGYSSNTSYTSQISGPTYSASPVLKTEQEPYSRPSQNLRYKTAAYTIEGFSSNSQGGATQNQKTEKEDSSANTPLNYVSSTNYISSNLSDARKERDRSREKNETYKSVEYVSSKYTSDKVNVTSSQQILPSNDQEIDDRAKSYRKKTSLRLDIMAQMKLIKHLKEELAQTQKFLTEDIERVVFDIKEETSRRIKQAVEEARLGKQSDNDEVLKKLKKRTEELELEKERAKEDSNRFEKEYKFILEKQELTEKLIKEKDLTIEFLKNEREAVAKLETHEITSLRDSLRQYETDLIGHKELIKLKDKNLRDWNEKSEQFHLVEMQLQRQLQKSKELEENNIDLEDKVKNLQTTLDFERRERDRISKERVSLRDSINSIEDVLKKEKEEKEIVHGTVTILDYEKKVLESKISELQDKVHSLSTEINRNKEDYENHIKNYDRRLEEVSRERDDSNEGLVKQQREYELEKGKLNYLLTELSEKLASKEAELANIFEGDFEAKKKADELAQKIKKSKEKKKNLKQELIAFKLTNESTHQYLQTEKEKASKLEDLYQTQALEYERTSKEYEGLLRLKEEETKQAERLRAFLESSYMDESEKQILLAKNEEVRQSSAQEEILNSILMLKSKHQEETARLRNELEVLKNSAALAPPQEVNQSLESVVLRPIKQDEEVVRILKEFDELKETQKNSVPAHEYESILLTSRNQKNELEKLRDELEGLRSHFKEHSTKATEYESVILKSRHQDEEVVRLLKEINDLRETQKQAVPPCELQTALFTSQAQSDEIVRLREELEGLRSSIHEPTARAVEFESIVLKSISQDEEIKRIRAELESSKILESQLNNQKTEYESILLRSAQQDEELRRLRSELEGALESKMTFNKDVEFLRETNNKLKSKKKDYKISVKNLLQTNQEVDVLKKQIEDEKASLESTTIIPLKDKIGLLETQYLQVTSDLKRKEQILKEDEALRAKLQKELKDRENEITELKRKEDAQRTKEDKLLANINKAVMERDSVKEELKKVKQQGENLQSELSKLKSNQASITGEIAESVVVDKTNQKSEKAKSRKNPESEKEQKKEDIEVNRETQEFRNRIVELEKINESQKQEIKSLKEKDEDKKKGDDKSKQQDTLEKENKKLKSENEQLKKDREEIFWNENKFIETTKKEISDLKQEKENLQKLLSEKDETLKKIKRETESFPPTENSKKSLNRGRSTDSMTNVSAKETKTAKGSSESDDKLLKELEEILLLVNSYK